jgi:RNA polymerase sigma factor (TIGR02999 family)
MPAEPFQTEESPDVTVLLRKWRQGDADAGRQVMELMYEQLHRMAGHQMGLERKEHTLQATALVNELYIRMVRGNHVDWQDRAHFLAVAARQLRRILVDHARKKNAARRSGVRVTVDDVDIPIAADQDVLDVDRALDELAKVDERVMKVIECRYFGGLSEEETSAALGISSATVRRDQTFGRAWIQRKLSSSRADAER